MIRAVECGWLVRMSASSTMYVVDEMRKKKNNNNMEGRFAGHEIQSTSTLHTKRFGVTLCIYILYQPARTGASETRCEL